MGFTFEISFAPPTSPEENVVFDLIVKKSDSGDNDLVLYNYISYGMIEKYISRENITINISYDETEEDVDEDKLIFGDIVLYIQNNEEKIIENKFTINFNIPISFNSLFNVCDTTIQEIGTIQNIFNYSKLTIKSGPSAENFNYVSFNDAELIMEKNSEIEINIVDPDNIEEEEKPSETSNKNFSIAVYAVVQHELEAINHKLDKSSFNNTIRVRSQDKLNMNFQKAKNSNNEEYNIISESMRLAIRGENKSFTVEGINNINTINMLKSKLTAKCKENLSLSDDEADININCKENSLLMFEKADDGITSTFQGNITNLNCMEKSQKKYIWEITDNNLNSNDFIISSSSEINSISSTIETTIPNCTIQPKKFKTGLFEITGKSEDKQKITIKHEKEDETDFNDIPNFSISGKVPNNLTVSNTGNFYSKNLTLKNLLDYKGSSVLIDSDIELNNDNIKKYEETLITEEKTNIDFKVVDENDHEYKLNFKELDDKGGKHQIQFKKLTISSDSLTVLSFPKPKELNLDAPDIEIIEILGDSKISFENLDKTKKQFTLRIPYGKKIEDVIVGELPKADFKVEIAPQTTDEQIKEMENKIDELTDKINNLNSKLNKALAVLILSNDKFFN